MICHHTYLCIDCYKALRDEPRLGFKKCPWCGGIMEELSYRVHIPPMKKREQFLEWYWNKFPGALKTLNDYKSKQGL